MASYCPISGCRVRTRPEWICRQVSPSFIVNFWIIGDGIIYSRPEGRADFEGVKKSVALKMEIANQFLTSGGTYIQIQDYARLKGSTLSARSYFINNANRDRRLKSMIFCNLSLPLSIAVKIGERFNTSRKIIRVEKQYRDAVGFALTLAPPKKVYPEVSGIRLGDLVESAEPSLGAIHIKTDHEWRITHAGFRNHSTLINQNILHSVVSGYLDVGGIERIDRMRDACRQRGGGEIGYIVVDASRLKGGSHSARIGYMKSLTTWYRRYPFSMYIVYGANTFMKTALRLARPLMPFDVRIADDAAHAFQLIREDNRGRRKIGEGSGHGGESTFDNGYEKFTPARRSARTRPSEPDAVHSGDIEALLAFMGRINWDTEGVADDISVSKSHPFYYLYHSVKLIKEEFDGHFKGRIQAEQSLRRTYSRYKRLFHESPVPLWEEDLTEVIQYIDYLKDRGVSDFRTYLDIDPARIKAFVSRVSLVDVNQAVLTLCGASDKEQLKAHFSRIFTGNALDVFGAQIVALANGETSFESEAEICTLPGEIKYIFLKLVVEPAQDGKVMAQVATTDITQSEQRFRAVANHTHDWETWIDPMGNLIWINPAAERITGHPKQRWNYEGAFFEWIGGLVVAADRKRVIDLLKKGVSERVSLNDHHFRIRRQDGRARWISMSYQPIYAEAGEYLGLRTSMRDITRRKEAEEALAKSESRLKMAMNSVNEAVWDWHLDKDDTYFSDRWYTMLGYTPENLPGGFDVWVSLVHPDDLVAVKKTIAGHLKSGAPFEIEFRVKASDGQWRWILGRGKTIGRNEKGRAERMLGTYTDITERKRVEEQLLQAQKIEAVGTLAGGIAHDFNNILGAIIGYTQLARMFYDDDKDKCFDSLDKVLTASYRARDLVNHILAFSRKSEVKDVPVYVPGMVKETLKMLRASLPATIVIRHEVDIPKGTVRIDPAQMHQVLMNLCTNAAHAMEENGGELSVCLNVMEKEAVDWPGTRIPTEDRYLAIQVSDTGHGIPAKVLPQIFEPYFTTKEKGQGTGLGLSIVYGIVKRYGGEVSVQSRPGFTVFTLYLPFDTKAPEGHSRDTGTVVTGEGRLLFVDDEAPLLEVARRLLSRLGYEIDTESNSKAAFERFKKQPHVYDLLITDQTMPGMTGLELAGKVRDIRPDLPILLCTGYSDKVNEDVLIKNNISAFVHKPLNAENLSHLVAGLLNPEGVAAGSDIN